MARFGRGFRHVAVLALLWATGAAWATGLLAPAVKGVSATTREQLQADPHVIRWRVAQWDANAVFDANATFGIPRRAHQEAPATEAAAPLVLNLFDDVAVKGHVQSAKTLEGGSRFLFGTLEDGGHFSLFRHGSGIVRGEVHSMRGGYILQSDGASEPLLVMQADLSKLASCDGTRHDAAASTAPVAELDIQWRTDWKANPGMETGRHETVDILVAYSQGAEDAIGGPDNVRAYAEYDVAYTNQVLENSGLAHRQIRLAGLVNVADRDPSLIDYPDVDRERRIRFKDLLAALRAEYQTDVTMFYRHTGLPGYATGGYTNDPSYRSYCALNPNPALCYYNVRKETWGTDIDDSRAIKAGAGYVNVGSLGLHASRTFSHEWGHEMAIRHDRYAWIAAVDDHRILRPMAYGHTYAHYLPGQDIPEWCQGTIMSYFTQCHDDERLRPPHIPPVLGVPNFSNPQIYYPRPKTSDFARIGWDDVEGPGASHPDVPMGVPGDQRTMALDGPADAARAIDEVWNIVADLSEPPFERLAGACNEGDMAADALASRLPARVAVTFADGGGKTYRPPVSGPAMCLDDVSLKGRSSNAAFDVATSDRGGERRLSVVATEPHYGACASSKRAVVAAELWDAVEEFPPEVIRQRVPGVSPAHLVVEQRSARSFCKGAPARHHLRRLGDFDGDGRADALLRHADGHWRYQPMDERGARAGSAASLNNNPAVSVAGVGDFNGDGRDDVLMRRADGSWRAYLMDGRRSIAGGGSVALPRDGWVDGIGDFNGDGKDDVLLQHEDGRRHYYPMDGRTVLQGGEAFGLAHEHWRQRHGETVAGGWVAGLGDFNDDGRDDALFRRSDGTWHYYPFYGRVGGETGLFAGHGEVRLPKDTAWAVAGVADFNGDGKADVLLRHEDGRWRYYAMDGRAIVEEAVPALPADPLVWLAGVGDTDGDGKADVLTRRGHSAWRVHRMDGGRVAGEAEVDLASESGWGVLTGGAVAPVETTDAVPPQPLALGADAALDLSAHFADDQTLFYDVHSTDVDVVRASVAGDILTLMPVTSGRATITVTARDPDGNTAVQSFSVVVSEDGTDDGSDGSVTGAARRSAFRDCAECPEMVVAPAGSFMMGAPADEAGSDATERPRHRVDFAAPFAIGSYEVTIEQWDACLEAGGCAGYRPSVDWTFQDPRWSFLTRKEVRTRPIFAVNWHDATAFADWLSKHTGQAYRLPSEAEWEYAARAGTKTPYHFGKTLTGQANYASVELEWSLGQSRVGGYAPTPVGWFAPNPWGLHDVHGNVGELTQDCWNASYVGAPTDGGAWEAGDCERRVVRGGHWLDEDPLALRSAKRRAMLAAEPREKPRGPRFVHGDATIGFRVARALSPLEAVATWIPAQTLSLGTDGTLDLAAHFGNDQTLSYEVRSSDAEVVRASVVGSTLTLRPIATGYATITVTARDGDGNTATQWFSAEVWRRDCAECPAIVAVPAGTFTMGAPESEYYSDDRERPQRTVSIPAFVAGVFEVTFAEWNTCVADGGCDGYRPHDEGWGFGRQPVVNVGWHDAQRYVEWLSLRTGHHYRLLTESEWEYAARAGTETPFHTGETITPQQANFDGLYGYPGDERIDGVSRRQTVPVGSFAPNAFGLHDVHGNVEEWVQDCNIDYDSEGARVDGGAVEPEGCQYRVLRGGSWAHHARQIRSAYRASRHLIHHSTRLSNIGFRVARDVVGAPSVEAPIADQPLATGEDATLDLSVYFSDDQALTYEAESSDADVVRVQVISGGSLLLASVAAGRATVTVTATDADGNAVRQTFQAIVSADGQVGRRFHDCSQCPEMVVVPAGSFMMGAPEEEEGSFANERPVHQVDFANAFAVGIHEVTFAQWDACVAAGGCDGYTPVIFHEEEARANRPVDALNWQDAQNYAAWLSAHTGETYRLPSEAEWEYAARAGTQTPYHFGATISPDQAQATYDVGTVVGTVPVGSFPANAWGLHDVHGNVAEWTQDCYDPSQWTYDGAPTDGSAREEGDCTKRVTRGGSRVDPPEELRSARRGTLWRADSRIGVNGIRVVRELGD